MRRYNLLIPVAALAIVLPLLAHGCSCGHDFSFHLQSWLEAANQLRHGTLYPRWAFSAAYNAGEPRFVFYPPISWMLGALLVLVLPAKAVTTAYTFLALTAAGFTMYRLASYFASPRAALLATTLYIANPYMLFTAFERTAYAELLAAAWLPLLFLAALRRRPSVTGIALPVALLWLTNAPAAVMGCYALAVIVAVRLISEAKQHKLDNIDTSTKPGAPGPDFRTRVSGSPLKLALTSFLGTALGLGLSAFYLVPAAYERRFVQIAMAIIPNMRFEDNFLFGHTDDAPHNVVLHTASLISLELLAATTAALILLYVLCTRTKVLAPNLAAHRESVVLSEAQSAKPKEPEALHTTTTNNVPPLRATLRSLVTLTCAIAILLTPISTPIWNHLPELAFLQFPWRLLSILAVCLSLATAFLLQRPNNEPRVHHSSFWRHERVRTIFLAAAILVILVPLGIYTFRQPCEDDDFPATHARFFAAHTGVMPTDEYTPNNADNDVLRADDPPFWFATDPGCFAPGTTPNPAATSQVPGACAVANPAVPGSAVRIRVPTAAPPPNVADAALNVAVLANHPPFLILNLRDYPAWNVSTGCRRCAFYNQLPHISRDDGLIAVSLPPGASTVHVTWQRTLDNTLGDILSVLALAIYTTLCIRSRSRRIEAQASSDDAFSVALRG